MTFSAIFNNSIAYIDQVTEKILEKPLKFS